MELEILEKRWPSPLYPGSICPAPGHWYFIFSVSLLFWGPDGCGRVRREDLRETSWGAVLAEQPHHSFLQGLYNDCHCCFSGSNHRKKLEKRISSSFLRLRRIAMHWSRRRRMPRWRSRPTIRLWQWRCFTRSCAVIARNLLLIRCVICVVPKKTSGCFMGDLKVEIRPTAQ